MKKALLLLIAIFFVFTCFGQDPEINDIIKKLRSGQQITQAEHAKLKEWTSKKSQAATGTENKQKNSLSVQSSGTVKTSGIICPKPAKSVPEVAELTREGFATPEIPGM